MSFQTITSDLSEMLVSSLSIPVCIFPESMDFCMSCLFIHNLTLLHRGQTFHDVPPVFHWYLQHLKADLANKDQGEECTLGTLAFTIVLFYQICPKLHLKNTSSTTVWTFNSLSFIPHISIFKYCNFRITSCT